MKKRLAKFRCSIPILWRLFALRVLVFSWQGEVLVLPVHRRLNLNFVYPYGFKDIETVLLNSDGTTTSNVSPKWRVRDVLL